MLKFEFIIIKMYDKCIINILIKILYALIWYYTGYSEFRTHIMKKPELLEQVKPEKYNISINWSN